MRTNKTWIVAVLIVVFAVVAAMPVMAQETEATGEKPAPTKNENFQFSAAVWGTWFALADLSTGYDYDDVENSVNNNFGLSTLVNMKFFKDYGATLGLEIDDPTFKTLTDFFGYLNIKEFLLKFDYHSFGGTVKWANEWGSAPEWLKDDYEYSTKWTAFSLLFDLAKFWENDYYGRICVAGGIFFATLELPEFMVNLKDDLSLLYGNNNVDTEKTVSSKNIGLTVLIDLLWPLNDEHDSAWNIWTLGDLFLGCDVSDSDLWYSAIDLIAGVDYHWYFESRGELGLALGLHWKLESCQMLDATMNNLGPTMRVVVKF